MADAANAVAAFQAPTSFGAPLTGITVEDLADPGKFFRVGREPIAIDVLPGIADVDFDVAWEKRVEGTIDPQRPHGFFYFRLRPYGCENRGWKAARPRRC